LSASVEFLYPTFSEGIHVYREIPGSSTREQATRVWGFEFYPCSGQLLTAMVSVSRQFIPSKIKLKLTRHHRYDIAMDDASFMSQGQMFKCGKSFEIYIILRVTTPTPPLDALVLKNWALHGN
jgi:hypothetical protein